MPQASQEERGDQLLACVPPLGSSNIFSMDLGPSVVLIMSATACQRTITKQ